MMARRVCGFLSVATVVLLTGCHHHAVVRAVPPPPPPPANTGPVMVSVPPPLHRSTDTGADVPTSSNIPVVKPVRPPKKAPRRTRSAPPLVASNTAPVAAPPVAAPPVAASTQPTSAQGLGQLTTTTDDPAATRDGSAQAMRRERDRLAAVPSTVQTAHAAEIDQARRFLKSAGDSWNASDYAAALALTTKARVLLDDLLK